MVSASRSLIELSRSEIVELACREIKEYFPETRGARLVQAHVIKEARATYSAVPGLESLRPKPETKYPNVFLAGDWTDTGWPATMEGAVRSGYRAAEAVAQAAGAPGVVAVALAEAIEDMRRVGAAQAEIPLLVQLIENPRYKVPGIDLFHGRVELHQHDAIHILLGRGLLNKVPRTGCVT